jgi:ceramide glucosyltransferase
MSWLAYVFPLDERTSWMDGRANIAYSAVGLAWWILVWSICLVGWQSAYDIDLLYPRMQDISEKRRDFFRRRKYSTDTLTAAAAAPSPSDSNLPGVSILRPLRGLDCNLYDNLESTFKQEYPLFEIICSVAEEDDAAIPVVRQLMEKHPTVPCRLIIGMKTLTAQE